MFGPWINNVENLKKKFNNAKPYKHIIIDNFLNEEYAEEIFKNYPTDLENWWKYWNPIEVKYANDNINNMHPKIKELFYILSTDKITKLLSQLSSINNLEIDPYLNGAGLHCHPRLGRLNLHLDYERHPILHNKERRLNIILYLTKDWKKEWHGDTQLWSKYVSECVVKAHIKFNRAVIFQTNEISWHGLPEKNNMS